MPLISFNTLAISVAVISSNFTFNKASVISFSAGDCVITPTEFANRSLSSPILLYVAVMKSWRFCSVLISLYASIIARSSSVNPYFFISSLVIDSNTSRCSGSVSSLNVLLSPNFAFAFWSNTVKNVIASSSKVSLIALLFISSCCAFTYACTSSYTKSLSASVGCFTTFDACLTFSASSTYFAISETSNGFMVAKSCNTPVILPDCTPPLRFERALITSYNVFAFW